MGDVSAWLATAENRADIRHLLYVSFAADAPRDFGRRIAAPLAAADAVFPLTPLPRPRPPRPPRRGSPRGRGGGGGGRFSSPAGGHPGGPPRDCTAARLAGMRA